ncbi:MAG TPA: hypothetical protein VFG01_03920 [Acidobacteriota bacterium]|nr:hypothetical protein [Acidobacteriota bacterium]
MGFDPKDCKAICDDLCGKKHVAIITKMWYQVSQSKSEQITIEAIVSFSYDLEPVSAQFFHVTAAKIPSAMISMQYTGDSKCSGPFRQIGGIFRETVKALGGEVTKLGGSRQYFGERLDATVPVSGGHLRQVYQFEIIQH